MRNILSVPPPRSYCPRTVDSSLRDVARGGLLRVGMRVMPLKPGSGLNPLMNVCTSPECVPRALSLAGLREHTPILFAHMHLVYAAV